MKDIYVGYPAAEKYLFNGWACSALPGSSKGLVPLGYKTKDHNIDCSMGVNKQTNEQLPWQPTAVADPKLNMCLPTVVLLDSDQAVHEACSTLCLHSLYQAHVTI